jgi:2-polyprenyl-3-methyl-5-hydroxy-6-metoxy-1,4-benzoquinol methylase
MSKASRRAALTEETACILCGRTDYDVIGTRDRDGRPLRTTMCRHCGLVWTNPRPTLDALDSYYGQDYRADYKNARLPSPRKLLRGMLGALERRHWLQPFLPPASRILDVGSGAGELVFVLRAAGFEAFGLEPDDAFAEYARDIMNVPVETGTVGTVSIVPASFDIVTMFHALEHVGDPVATVTTIAKWLEPSGLLVIEVPNVEATCQAPDHRFHYAHLFSFSQGTLRAVAAQAGLAQIRMELSPDGGNIIAVFRKRAAAPQTDPLVDLQGQYERTRQLLREHTQLRHYLSLTPYMRAVARLGRHFQESRLLARLDTADGILKWASNEAFRRSVSQEFRRPGDTFRKPKSS